MNETASQPCLWTTRPFGITSRGEAVTCYRMENASGAWVEILDYGCTLRALCVPDRDGNLVDVVLGYDSIADYEQGTAYLGAVIGRCSNRIAGARLLLDGKSYPLSANEGNNQLHGGARGFDKHMWTARCKGNSLILRRRSPSGEEGYPGNLEVAAAYTWGDDNALTLEFTAVSDSDTVVSLTSHPYFNLSGKGKIDEHTLRIPAVEYTETGAGNLVTGRILPVDGTSLDFRRPKPISLPLDYNFCFLGTGFHTAAQLISPESGILLTVETTQPGLQVYTGDFLGGPAGKGGIKYGPRNGVALEAQGWPDAAAWPAFPSSILRRDKLYRQRIAFSFSVRA